MQEVAVQKTQMQEEIRTAMPEAALRLADLDLTLESDGPAIDADWRRLIASPLMSLHQGIDWCRAWVATHGTRLVILKGTHSGRTVLLLPLEIVRQNGVRTARFPGGSHNNINTGLYDPDLIGPDPIGRGLVGPNQAEIAFVARAIAAALGPVADLLLLDCVALDWRGRRHPLAAFATIESQNHAFQLPLFANFEATLAQLNAKTRRKKFRSQSRKLEAIGGFDHVTAKTPDEKHTLLDTFFRQKSERLKLFGLPDVFQPGEIRNFFHRLLDIETTGPDTPLELHAIRLKGEHPGHVAAVAGLSRKGDHVICQFSSIDESICPEASPGELLFWLMIEECCHSGAALFDFGVGDQGYKRSWCTQETVQYNMLLPLTWKGRVARPVMTLKTRAKTAIKQNKALYATLQRLRAGRAPSAAAQKTIPESEDPKSEA